MKKYTLKITPTIRKALLEWYEDKKLTQTKIADMIGVKNPSVNGWLNADNKSIKNENWLKLLPHLKPYLHTEEYKKYAEQDYWVQVRDTSGWTTIYDPNNPEPSKEDKPIHQKIIENFKQDRFLQIILESWEQLSIEERGELATSAAAKIAKKATDSKVG